MWEPTREYTLFGNTLTFKGSGGTLTINNFKDGDLGIRLEKEKEEEEEGDGTASQGFSSPLVLDLNGNGVTSTSIFDSTARFDLEGDGFREKSGWVEGQDGLLAMDRDQNGVIDNGGELFGNYTQDEDGKYFDNGFDALAAMDDNKDGKIDGADERFDAVRIWQDANGDGVSQADELKTLDEYKITEIRLDAEEANRDEERNQVTHEAVFVQHRTDDQGDVLTDNDGNPLADEKSVRDVRFMRDNQDTVYGFDGEVPPEVQALPDMKGTGRVMNLTHAMAGDAILAGRVEAMLAGAGR